MINIISCFKYIHYVDTYPAPNLVAKNSLHTTNSLRHGGNMGVGSMGGNCGGNGGGSMGVGGIHGRRHVSMGVGTQTTCKDSSVLEICQVRRGQMVWMS